VTAVGSGGTAAGLMLGLELAGLDTKVLAVVVNDTLRLDRKALTRLASRSAQLLRRRGAQLPNLEPQGDRLVLVDDQIGPGYGHSTAAAGRARDLTLELAGVELDPVYTAKAMAGLLSVEGKLDPGPVVFIDTNGPRD